jgi:hypothetical protein
MVVYRQTQQDCLAVEVSMALSNDRVWLILEDFLSRDELVIARSISSNPKYIDWLNANKNNLLELFMRRDWFISPDHKDGSTKYLRELKQEIAELVNSSESAYPITEYLDPNFKYCES